MKYKESRGNVLFIILLGVVLIAALSLAIRGSTRSGGNDASGEKASAYAGEIMQMGNLFASTVARLQINNECEDTEISFQNTVVTGYTNSLTPSDGRCKVFDPAGGGLSFKTMDAAQLVSNTFSGGVSTNYNLYAGKPTFLSTQMVSSSARDLVMVIPFISQTFCQKLNEIANGSNSVTVSSSTVGYLDTIFTGSYSSGQDLTTPTSYQSGCAYRTGDNFYMYYHILIAR